MSRDGRRFGNRLRVPASRSARDISLSMDARGDIAITWLDFRFDEEDPEGGECCSFVVATTRPAGGPFAAPQRLTDPTDGSGDEPVEPPAVAIGPGGRTVVAWPESCEPFAAVTRAGSPFPRKRRVAPFDPGICDLYVSSQDPAPAVTREGHVLFTYALGDLDKPRELRSTRVFRNGKRAYRLLARRGRDDFNNTAVLTADGGERLAVWGDDRGLLAGFARPAGAPLAVKRVTRSDATVIAGAASGAALIGIEGPRSSLSLLTRGPGLPFGPPVAVPRRVSGTHPEGAISSRGAVALADEALRGGRVRVAAGRSARALSSRRVYRCLGVFCAKPSVTIDDRSGALVAWQDRGRARFARLASLPR